MDLGIKLKMIDDSFKRKGNSDLVEMDLTVAQHRTLVYLVRKEGHVAELKEIEREFRVSQPTVAGIAQRLEAKGYVRAEQHPSDKRIKLIRLTPEGEALCKRSWEKMHARTEHMTTGLSEEEIAELERMLDVIYRNIEAMD